MRLSSYQVTSPTDVKPISANVYTKDLDIYNNKSWARQMKIDDLIETMTSLASKDYEMISKLYF